MTDTAEPKAKTQDRDTFVLGVERKVWILDRSKSLGLGKSEYIRRLIDRDKERAVKGEKI